MATERRLIDANDVKREIWNTDCDVYEFCEGCVTNMGISRVELDDAIDRVPTVDAVEVSRLGELGRLMMPYEGCPRGRMGRRGDGGIAELDPIKDIEGDRWIPVLEDDLDLLKEKAAEVVHGRWEEYLVPHIMCCSECDWATGVQDDFNYCPNCGAKMDLEEM